MPYFLPQQKGHSMKRVLIIINKSWEADAALSAIFNDDICHPSLDYKKAAGIFTLQRNILDFPRERDQGSPTPRAVFTTANYQYELWCIQNIMTPQPKGNTDPLYYSNSYQKSVDFPKILAYSAEAVAMVVAFGTAGAPTEVSKNGGLVIGSNVFIYDVPHQLPVYPKYDRPEFGQLVPSSVAPKLFDRLNLGLSPLAMHLYFEGKALLPPINPAPNFPLVADGSIVAVSDVNIASYADFATADPDALAAYSKAYPPPKSPVAYSVETTHGIIRLEAGCANFMFISAITDRDAYFNQEDVPRASAQNFSCAFNGGIFLSWFLPCLESNYALVG
jgi:hypothetical protein